MLNKPTNGSHPIKNEQSGMNKSEGYRKYQKSTIGCDIYERGAYEDGWDDGVQSIQSELTRILTAAKVSTVDEVVQMLERHPLSPEDIESQAKWHYPIISKDKFCADFRSYDEYVEDKQDQRASFIAGANFAKQPHSKEWVKVEDVRDRIKSNIQRYNVIPALEKTLDWLDSLLPHPPKK